jgi:hypothetical protein
MIALRIISLIEQFFATLHALCAGRFLSCYAPRAICYVLLLLALASCNLPPPPAASVPRRAGEGTLALFLNGPSRTPFSIAIDLAALESVREDGSRHPILTQGRTIS